MPGLIQNFEERPYNQCLNCAHIGKKCDGPNFLAMDSPRLTEWCRQRKEYLHTLDPKWTNAYIAEQAGLSKTSVDRFLAGNSGDLKTSTVSQILKILVNGSWGQYPCAMGAWANSDLNELNAKLSLAQAENKYLADSLAIMKEEYSRDTVLLQERADRQIEHMRRTAEFQEEQLRAKDRQIEEKDAQIAKKDKQMTERADFMRRKDRVMRILAVLLAVCVLLIIAALTVDLLSPSRGFFWGDPVSSASSLNYIRIIIGGDTSWIYLNG